MTNMNAQVALERENIVEYFTQVKAALFSHLPEKVPEDLVEPHIVMTIGGAFRPTARFSLTSPYGIMRLIPELFDANEVMIYPISLGGINEGKQTQVAFSVPNIVTRQGNDIRDVFEGSQSVAVLDRFDVTEFKFRQFPEPYVPAPKSTVRFIHESKPR